MASKRFTVLSAFTGLGGLDLGLERAGFHSVGCLEWDPDARRSLKANRDGSWPLIGEGDVAVDGIALRPSHVGLRRGQLSVLAGGPPCQPFSKAGQWNPSARLGDEDPRASYTDDFFEIAVNFAPRVVLIENVPGFVAGPTSRLAYLESKLSELRERTGRPYRLQWRVLNAAEFGVPQRRRRAIVVMTTLRAFDWPAPVRFERTSWDAIGDSPDALELPVAGGQFADLLPTIPEGHNYQWHTSRGGGMELFGYRTRYSSFLKKLHRYEPAPTLAASPGPSTGPFHWSNRPLSVWEMLRLQSFPGEWIVEGNRRAQVRQVGNATPPLLAEVLGRMLGRAMGLSFDGEPALSIGERTRPHGPLLTEDVPTGQRMRLEGPHSPHPGEGKGPKPRLAGPEDEEAL